ncbi:hypothetical protein BC936DRAFT_143069 [Jimgerdemannia flammicorona]|uniref:Uncharacterized protein n=1 Tax=Jimgerdemannia flammicorona TaxID=994334 RepID=A0A433DEG4_9FUNG|nr:hypothetical protein BC936DRAFT_143069 [Jimgerdemannia flammicorona]
MHSATLGAEDRCFSHEEILSEIALLILHATYCTEQGKFLARRSGAQYHECSSKMDAGIREISEAATRAALEFCWLERKLCQVMEVVY